MRHPSPVTRHPLPLIHVSDLTFRFQGAQTEALRRVNLSIAPGDFVVITGPSGSGKSTLALALSGYLFAQFDGETSGSVVIGGMDARETPIYDLAEVVGLVQQNPEAQFCTLTARDEVAFGLENRCLPRAEIRERIAWALDVVGARELEGRALATLSGGEKQKIAIAAMLAARPQVLIFDEPTSNLDPAATADIFAAIARIRAESGVAVVVIEHKTDYLRAFAPRYLRVAEGELAESAPPPPVTLPACAPPRHVNGAAPLAEVRGLHAGYNGRAVLHDVSLSIAPGEFVAVMGDNGAGKTTLLRCLLGLLKPRQGHVTILGQDTQRAPVSQLAREVGFVFQNPDHQLFAESVWEEATFAPRNFGALDEAAVSRVEALLAQSGLAHRRAEHPYRLSYGQKRRLNLASILSYAPRLLLLDEILIGQDPENAEFLLSVLRERAAAGSAVVMINHSLEATRRYADRLLFFAGGRLIVDAPTDAAFAELRARGWRHYAPEAGA